MGTDQVSGYLMGTEVPGPSAAPDSREGRGSWAEPPPSVGVVVLVAHFVILGTLGCVRAGALLQVCDARQGHHLELTVNAPLAVH
eukprot:2047701-Rhodomonas_salina.5